jgi:hypothetical protein
MHSMLLQDVDTLCEVLSQHVGAFFIRQCGLVEEESSRVTTPALDNSRYWGKLFHVLPTPCSVYFTQCQTKSVTALIRFSPCTILNGYGNATTANQGLACYTGVETVYCVHIQLDVSPSPTIQELFWIKLYS